VELRKRRTARLVLVSRAATPKPSQPQGKENGAGAARAETTAKPIQLVGTRSTDHNHINLLGSQDSDWGRRLKYYVKHTR